MRAKVFEFFKKLSSVLKRFIQFIRGMILTEKFKIFIGYVLVVLSVVFTASIYNGSVVRLFSSLWDFITAIGYYGTVAFKNSFEAILGYVPIVNTNIAVVPEVDLQKYVPFDIKALMYKVEYFPEALFSGDTLTEYNSFLMLKGYEISMWSMLLVPLLLLIPLLIKTIVAEENDLPSDTVSRPLNGFYKLLRVFVQPLYKWLKSTTILLWKKKYIRISLICIWLVNLNVLSIAFSAFGYYYYFIASFSLSSFQGFFTKLIVDVIIMLSGAPIFCWIAAALAVYIVYIVKRAFKELKHQEAMNCGYLKTVDYCLLIVGRMGKGKTTLLTSIALLFEKIFKQIAMDIMMKQEMLFPAFNFNKFREDLDKAIEDHEIYCIPCCDDFVEKLLLIDQNYYKYREDIFKTERYTGTAVKSIESAMKTYARAYWIYSNDTAIVSTFPIRLDGRFLDTGHFKKWDNDFYKRKASDLIEDLRYSRIFDEDIFRQGKKIDPNGTFNGSFGYGIYVEAELGGDRGNKNTNEDKKKEDKATNQKNDLWNYSLRFIRHPNSTVDNEVFSRFLSDDQRPENVAADTRDILSIVQIAVKSELMLTLPFGTVLDKIYDKVYEPFKDFYYDLISKRSDATLTIMLPKMIVGAFSRGYHFLYNTFGYYELRLGCIGGDDYTKGNYEAVQLHTYYLHPKQVYSYRFSTDTHSSHFTKAQLEAELGIRDYPCFKGLKMTDEEMTSTHNYMVEELKKIARSGKKQPQTKTKVPQVINVVENDVDTENEGILFF